MSRNFDRIRRGREDVVDGRFRIVHPTAKLVALLRPEAKGTTIYCDPDPLVIEQLIQHGRAEVKR